MARRVPDEIRARLVCTADPIMNVVNHAEDRNMQLLFAVWSEFLHPWKKEDITCWKCRGRIIEEFRGLRDDLIKLEREHRMLESFRT